MLQHRTKIASIVDAMAHSNCGDDLGKKGASVNCKERVHQRQTVSLQQEHASPQRKRFNHNTCDQVEKEE